jgi:flagellar protein FlaG
MAASVAAQQEPQEKRAPHPSEEKVPVEHSEFLPGTRKPQSPDLKQTALGLEQISLAFNRRLKFIIDQESKEIIIKVIDNETDKVIKVLPPEELQRLHSRIRETIGFLIDRMV